MEFVFNEYNRMTQGNPVKVIVEFGSYASMDKEAREFLQEHKTVGICEAIVISNTAQRLLINFYFKLKKHSNPSKAFNSLENAMSWVKTF